VPPYVPLRWIQNDGGLICKGSSVPAASHRPGRAVQAPEQTAGGRSGSGPSQGMPARAGSMPRDFAVHQTVVSLRRMRTRRKLGRNRLGLLRAARSSTLNSMLSFSRRGVHHEITCYGPDSNPPRSRSPDFTPGTAARNPSAEQRSSTASFSAKKRKWSPGTTTTGSVDLDLGTHSKRPRRRFATGLLLQCPTSRHT
jgi:hypothetical protein